MCVLLHQQRDPGGVRGVDAHAVGGAHAMDQRLGHAQVADLAALGFHVDRARGIQAPHRIPQAGLERFLRRLRAIRPAAEQRTAMSGDGFEIEHLATGGRQCADQAGLARAGGTTHHTERQPRRQHLEFRHHMPTKCPVAAVELPRVPADGAQDGGHRAAAHAAAPAVDQRLPAALVTRERLLDVLRDVARDQRGADLAGEERRLLHVHRADAGALGVVEHRNIDGAGQVVERKFGGRTHVEQGVETLQFGYGRDVVAHDVGKWERIGDEDWGASRGHDWRHCSACLTHREASLTLGPSPGGRGRTTSPFSPREGRG